MINYIYSQRKKTRPFDSRKMISRIKVVLVEKCIKGLISNIMNFFDYENVILYTRTHISKLIKDKIKRF